MKSRTSGQAEVTEWVSENWLFDHRAPWWLLDDHRPMGWYPDPTGEEDRWEYWSGKAWVYREVGAPSEAVLRQRRRAALVVILGIILIVNGAVATYLVMPSPISIPLLQHNRIMIKPDFTIEQVFDSKPTSAGAPLMESTPWTPSLQGPTTPPQPPWVPATPENSDKPSIGWWDQP